MSQKAYVNAVAPSGGRVYSIVSVGDNQNNITDVTDYEVVGSEFGSSDIMAVCLLPFDHTRSGTVHQLTSPNTTAQNIKFTATANYMSGDTFSVNGQNVTAVTLNGSSLVAGCFISGSVVSCFLSGTTLYFSDSMGSVDAATLDGQPASAFMPKAGGSFTGTAYAQSASVDAICLRNFRVLSSSYQSVATNYIWGLRK